MSTQIQVRIQIRRGPSKDNIFYVNDKEAMFALSLDMNTHGPGFKLNVGDIIKVENENRRIDKVWVMYHDKTLRTDEQPSTGYESSSSTGLSHAYNCEIIYETSKAK